MRERKRKNKIIIFLIGIVLLMATAYGAFQSQINISGTSNTTNTWDVEITNVQVGNTTGQGKNAKTPTWNALTASLEADIFESGDSVSYNITVANLGTLDATLDNITKNITTNNEAVKIEYSGFSKGERLYKYGHSGSTKTITVTISYNDEYEGELDYNTSTETSVTFDYVQAKGNETDPDVPIPTTYHLVYNYTENGGSSTTAQNEYFEAGTNVHLEGTASKKGYTFIGWNTDKDAQIGLSTVTLSEDKTVYAIYKKTITITYQKGTNVSTIGRENDICNVYNKTTSCQKTLPAITVPTGYGVDGWYKGDTKLGNPNTNQTFTENTTLVAKASTNELDFDNQNINKTFNTDSQTFNITGATGGSGTYTYTEVSEKKGDTPTNYISISGTTVTVAADTPAGTYTYVIKAKDTVTGAEKQATYTIVLSKKDATCPTLDNYSGQYDGSAHSISVGSNASGGTVKYRTATSGDGSTWTTTKPTWKDFTNGAKTVYVEVEGDGNHNTKDCGSKTVTINKKEVALGTHSATYNGTTSYSRTFSTGVGSETLALTYTPNAKTAAAYTYSTSAGSGKYTVAAANGTGTASNYTITGGGTFTINKKALTISAYSVTWTSGTTYTRSNYDTGVNSEKITLTYTPNTNTPGTYTYATSTASGKYTLALSDSTNYSISSAGDLTITALTATIPTAANYCKTGLVYNGSSQTIVKTAGTGYTWTAGTTRTNAGSQNVTATLSPGYKWSDNTTGTKTISCSIDKATPELHYVDYIGDGYEYSIGENNPGVIVASVPGTLIASASNNNVTITSPVYGEENTASKYWLIDLAADNALAMQYETEQACTAAIPDDDYACIYVAYYFGPEITGNNQGTTTIDYGFEPTDNTNYDVVTLTEDASVVDLPPTVQNIAGGTTQKATSQTLTLKCSDNVGVTAYYWGTTEPSSASSITTTTAADLTALQSSSGLTKSVSAQGTYWLACKDISGNFNKKSITIRKYQVQNVVEKIAGAATPYNSTNYATSGSASTYYIKDGTKLTLASTYTVPTEANQSNKFKGYTTAAPSGTNQTPTTTNTSTPTVTNNTTTYYMWWNRNTYTVGIYSADSEENEPSELNGTVTAETQTQTNNSVTLSALGKVNLTVKHGDTVKATATPSTGYSFTGWSGGYVSGTTNPVTGAAVTAAKTIIGTFADNTAPTVSLSPNTQSTFVSGGKAVTVTLSDAGSGLKASQTVSYAWSTSSSTAPTSWSTLTTSNTAVTTNPVTVTVPATASSSLTGQYYLWIKNGIQDDAENPSVNKTSAVFKFDNTNPTVSLNTSSTTNSITAVATASAASGISKYEFSKDDGTTWVDNGTSNTYTFTGLSNASSTYPIKVRVTSGVNKTATASKTESLKTLTPPTFSQNKNVTTITYQAGCGTDFTCTYSKDGGSAVTVNSTTANVTFSAQGNIVASITDGTNTANSTYTFDPAASNLSFDNTETGLDCSDAQCAIDEISGELSGKKTIYRWSTTALANKGSEAASSNPYTITNLTEGTDYVTNPSTLNKTYYLKHDVVNDEIINSYVCFVYNNAEHCMKGADGGTSFAANTQIIQDYQTFYNLPNNANPGCYFYSSVSDCNGGGFGEVYASSDGYVNVTGSSSGICIVSTDGVSNCIQ